MFCIICYICLFAAARSAAADVILCAAEEGCRSNFSDVCKRSFITVVFKMNRAVNVFNNNTAFYGCICKLNLTFTASAKKSSLYRYIIKINIASADSVTYDKVTVYRNITESNLTGSDKTAVSSRIYECTLLCVICFYYIVHHLGKFFSCDIIFRANIAVVVTVYIFLGSKYRNIFLCPIGNICAVSECGNSGIIRCFKNQSSCDCRKNFFSCNIVIRTH